MRTELVIDRRRQPRQRNRARLSRAPIVYRAGRPDDAPALHGLITSHLEEGHLLPRQLDELRVHASRFVVAVRGRAIVGCAELAPLSGRVAEVRSLVVDASARRRGIGQHLIEELQRLARWDGFEELCAFTHDPAFFVRHGFSIVPHAWLPEKIARDCQGCALFRRCGQHAVVLPLQHGRPTARGIFVPLAALRVLT